MIWNLLDWRFDRGLASSAFVAKGNTMMKTPLVMPQLGNEIEEAQIDGWAKAVGDRVEKGEALVTVTTPKVTLELEAPTSGILTEILVDADDLALVGATLAIITTP
jgi:pyruvate/2-oxoglutarate dehydrogenase complex dihydrolipoamide acyltransferase (E2) component